MFRLTTVVESEDCSSLWQRRRWIANRRHVRTRIAHAVRVFALVLLGCGLLLLGSRGAWSAEIADIDSLLRKADNIKSGNYSEFVSTIAALERREAELSSSQRQYLHYFQGWRDAYNGNYENAISTLKSILSKPTETTLQFRVHATIVNVLSIAKRYEDAFLQLTQMLDLLPQVTDKGAREQGLAVAALLYKQVKQYDLSIKFGQLLIDNDPSGSGGCKGMQMKLESLYKSTGRYSSEGTLQQAINTCVGVGDLLRANLLRYYAARMSFDDGRTTDAINQLKERYSEVVATQYSQLIAYYDVLLAEAYLKLQDAALAERYSSHAIEHVVKNEFTEAQVSAYRVLYTLARQRGDTKAALSFYEKYATADKAYLDDTSASQLAYQRAKHEALANRTEIEALNKQNEVLRLRQELAGQAVENSRLYIVMLTMVLAFIGLWAYKTKRSQVHFRKLARQDGLTGIFNRPHFIEQAGKILADGERTDEQTCVILCDLDHFKSINDKYGHAGGDFVLKQAVSAFQRHLGSRDVLGRFGGEEFCILLPGCDPTAARERCELIRKAIAEIIIQNEEQHSGVTASFGIAATAISGYELRQLLAHADNAMYRAKRAGRDRVTLHEDVETKATDDRTLPDRRAFSVG